MKKFGIVLFLAIFVFFAKPIYGISKAEIRVQLDAILAKLIEISKLVEELKLTENATGAIAEKSLKILSPIENQKWETGKTSEIKWETTGYQEGEKVKIFLIDERKEKFLPTYKTQIMETNNSGSHSYKIPDSIGGNGLYGSLYKIEVEIGENSDKKSATSSYFTISAGLPAYISVVSPAGGESLEAGKVYRIKWDSLNMEDSKISISLLSSDAEILIIADKIQNKSYLDWTVPTNSYGSAFKIVIRSYDNYQTLLGTAKMNSYFKIIAPIGIGDSGIKNQLASIYQLLQNLAGTIK